VAQKQYYLLMKKLFIVALLLTLLTPSCKETVEAKKEDLVIQIMTTGRWYVERYEDNGSDVTADFFGYEFQFYADGKVDGIKNTTTKSGTWTGNATTLSIAANFPLSAGDTLKRLNYTWRINDSGLDYVKSSTNVPGGTNVLNLRKK
jgi:hypothetical protein